MSCGSKDRDLGDKFILYKGDIDYPLSIGIDVGKGGVQGLLDGDIVEVGYNNLYLTVKMRDNKYYYIEKSSSAVEGPLAKEEFHRNLQQKGLPPLGKL